MLITFGHCASHSRWFVHEPKWCSISSTMPIVRRPRSGWPWGRRLRCASFAAVKSCPAPLGQDATQAPQPMHAAASIARSASSLGTRTRLASGALPVVHADVAAGRDDEVERRAVDDEVLDEREPGRAPRLDRDDVAVGELAAVELARRGAALRPVRLAVDHEAAGAADALAAVALERDRVLVLQGQALVEEVEHLQERHLRASRPRRGAPRRSPPRRAPPAARRAA